MDPLLERARREGTPLVDGDRATFVWEGDHAPRLIGDFNGFGWGNGGAELEPVSPGIWSRTFTFEPDAYLEYVYVDAHGTVPDPFNARRVGNGFGASNHYFTMPEFQENPFLRRRRTVTRGKLARHVVDADHLVVGSKRTVYLYRPTAPGPYPLLVIWDGQDYLRRARITTVVDNMIADGQIRPIALALPEHGRQARYVEYCCNDATLAFLIRSVVPLARQHLDLVDVTRQPGAHAVMGASLGGLMALYAGLRLPDVFGNVLSQSGSFAFEVQHHPSACEVLVRHEPVVPLRIWMDCGRYEFLHSGNREMQRLLQSRGYDATYREYSGGHNYGSWCNDLWRGLEALFPPAQGPTT